MNIILDSNVLFSALIKDSITRKIILEYEGFFLFPSYIFLEAEKHKKELLRKSKMKEEEFNELFGIILKKVLIVPVSVLYPYKKEALKIIKDIDINDVLFVACALAYPNSIIWSDDKRLKNQSKIKVLNTMEMMKLSH